MMIHCADLSRVLHRELSTTRIPRHSAIGCEQLEGRKLLSSLKQDVLHLAHDLYGLHKGSNVTIAKVQVLASDLKAIGQVATRPDPSTVAALKKEIGVVVANGAITPAEAVILKKDVAAVLASANIPASLVQQTTSDLQAVITASGITKQDVKMILGDVKAIVTDLGSLKK